MNALRRFLYQLASFLGDVNAVRKGAIVKRVLRKHATKVASRTINRWLK